MEIQELCSKLSDYYGLYFNETNLEVSKKLYEIILILYTRLSELIKNPSVYDPY